MLKQFLTKVVLWNIQFKISYHDQDTLFYLFISRKEISYFPLNNFLRFNIQIEGERLWSIDIIISLFQQKKTALLGLQYLIFVYMEKQYFRTYFAHLWIWSKNIYKNTSGTFLVVSFYHKPHTSRAQFKASLITWKLPILNLHYLTINLSFTSKRSHLPNHFHKML